MDQLNLFPKEIIKETVEHHVWKHSIHSQIIYTTTLFCVVSALLLLPLLHVDVSIKGKGIVRPESDIKILTSPVSGQIVELEMNENETVHEGELLVKISSPILEEQLSFNELRQQQVDEYIKDLIFLTELDTTEQFDSTHNFESSFYERSFGTFRQKLQSSLTRLDNSRSIYRRNRYLYEKKAISALEFEDSEYALHSLKTEFHLLVEQQLTKWEEDLARYRTESERLDTKYRQLVKEYEQFEVYAPLTGTIQNLAALSEGSHIQINQKLAEISPVADLLVETYVLPRDVGLLRKGMEVTYQIEAFDHTYWGTLTGEITDISEDAVMYENKPYFRIHSTLDRNYLELPHGYKGHLKKGMTLQARFIVTRRSLFQLLYDDVEDWLNPAWS